MRPPSLEVLYEDNHLLAVVKPAGLATMGVAADRPSLLQRARQYVKARYQKPGNVYLGVVSRLDAPVTGVVLFARTSKAARRLTEQFRTRVVRKTYWAIVEGTVQPKTGECIDFVGRDERLRRMQIVGPRAPGAQEARLVYRHLKTSGGLSLVEVELQTGRKHQIRLQLARRGWPILGDKKYGSRRTFPAGIALHARRLAIVHPVKGETIEFVAPLPQCWRGLGIAEGF
jgi:23S rRNA pseudouridine1911/1915/1917 synthase